MDVTTCCSCIKHQGKNGCLICQSHTSLLSLYIFSYVCVSAGTSEWYFSFYKCDKTMFSTHVSDAFKDINVLAASVYNGTDSYFAVKWSLDLLWRTCICIYGLWGIEGLYNFKLCVKLVQYYVLFSLLHPEGSFVYRMYYYHVLVKETFS